MEINAVTSDNNTGAVTSTPDYSFRPHGPSEADSNVGTMSFDDFLDMINPLEHIPLVSSIYRAVSGETINPVSRIAGDALYGGVFGLAAAGVSALGAAADEAVASLTGGKSASSYIMASIFGDDKDAPEQTTQLAANSTATPATPAADTNNGFQMAGLLQTPARQSPILSIPDFSTPVPTATQIAAATPPATPAATASASDDATPVSTAKAFALDRSKLGYNGGVDNATIEAAQQNQNLALALTSNQNNMQAQRAIRSNRFAIAATNPAAADAMSSPLTAPVQSLSIPGSSSITQIEPKTQAAMDNLLKELKAMKGASQYQSAAQNGQNQSSSVDLSN